MPKEGFDSITVKKKVLEYFDGFKGPLKNRQAFLVDLLEFWDKYHCPECGDETAVKEKHHKC